MLNARINASNAVTEKLLPAEDAIEGAFQQVSSLLDTMFAARRDANLGARVAREEFGHISNALALLSQAREHIFSAHDSFVQTRTDILPTVKAWGDEGCPKNHIAHPELRAVA